jgi:hypothetical protein
VRLAARAGLDHFRHTRHVEGFIHGGIFIGQVERGPTAK